MATRYLATTQVWVLHIISERIRNQQVISGENAPSMIYLCDFAGPLKVAAALGRSKVVSVPWLTEFFPPSPSRLWDYNYLLPCSGKMNKNITLSWGSKFAWIAIPHTSSGDQKFSPSRAQSPPRLPFWWFYSFSKPEPNLAQALFFCLVGFFLFFALRNSAVVRHSPQRCVFPSSIFAYKWQSIVFWWFSIPLA